MTPIRVTALALALLALAATDVGAWPRRHASPHHAGQRHPCHGCRRHTVDPAAIRVHDGDTFYVGPQTIRLRGIDTPELGQPKSRAATRRLEELLRAGPVTIVPRAEDVYGRTVAEVYVGGRDVAEVLRREGFEKTSPH